MGSIGLFGGSTMDPVPCTVERLSCGSIGCSGPGEGGGDISTDSRSISKGT